jgi:GntR family transcriptional regulator
VRLLATWFYPGIRQGRAGNPVLRQCRHFRRACTGTPYVQVANHISSLIESGELQPGTRLPPERELAKTFGVAYDTARRANELLRERGLIVTVHGRGTFVKPAK